YRRALEFDPSTDKVRGEAVALYRARGEHEEVERLLKEELDLAKAAEDRERIVRVLDELAEVYRGALAEPDLAVDAFEAAQAFAPEDARVEKLAALYAADPAQYLDKAIEAQAALLRHNPYRVESYKLLRQLYAGAQRTDPAWCLSQALTILRLADAEEE